MTKRNSVLVIGFALVLILAVAYGLAGEGFEIFKAKTDSGEESVAQTSEFSGWIKMMRSHASPRAGEDWEVTFMTQGKGDLEIIPQDQATIDHLSFVSLYCGEDEIEPEISKDGVILVKDWQCDEKLGALTHNVSVEHKHTLRFNFQAYYAFAYNSPETVTDSFTDRSKLASWLGLETDTAAGKVRLAPAPLRAFVTSETWAGDLGGLEGAAKLCQAAANSAGLGGEWVALLTGHISICNRMTQSAGNYVLLDGTLVADNWDMLKGGSIYNPITLTENLEVVSGSVWTGVGSQTSLCYMPPSGSDGRCKDWYYSGEDVTGLRGHAGWYLGYTTAYWLRATPDVACNSHLMLYCFEL